MKRLILLIGTLGVLTGIAVILPALANYGRPAPMVGSAMKALYFGSALTLAGVATVINAIWKRKDHATQTLPS